MKKLDNFTENYKLLNGDLFANDITMIKLLVFYFSNILSYKLVVLLDTISSCCLFIHCWNHLQTTPILQIILFI